MSDRYWRDKHDVLHRVDPEYRGRTVRMVCGEYMPGFTAGRFFISEPFTNSEHVTCIACNAGRKYDP